MYEYLYQYDIHGIENNNKAALEYKNKFIKLCKRYKSHRYFSSANTIVYPHMRYAKQYIEPEYKQNLNVLVEQCQTDN